MPKYTFIDLETTGLNPEFDQIIEYALLQVDDLDSDDVLYTGSKVKLEDGRTLSPIITQLTGYTDDDLKDGVSVEEAKKIIKDFCEGSIIVAQFASFDLSFIYDVVGEPDFYCTRTISKMYNPDESSSLKPTCERLGITLENHHTAFGDAEACMKLFKRYVALIGKTGIKNFKNQMVNTDERNLRYIPKNAYVIDLRKTRGGN